MAAGAGTTRGIGGRLYGPVLAFGLLGAVGVMVGATNPWATATSRAPGLPTIHASASGADLAPLVSALGVVVLAAFGAVIATRGVVRRLLGAAVLVASGAILVSTLDPGGATDVLTAGLSAKGWSGGGYQTSTEAWRWLVLVCSVVTALAGAATAGYGDQWAVMGSRYDAPRPSSVPTSTPAGEAPDDLTETDVWKAIDQGRDPTQAP